MQYAGVGQGAQRRRRMVTREASSFSEHCENSRREPTSPPPIVSTLPRISASFNRQAANRPGTRGGLLGPSSFCLGERRTWPTSWRRDCVRFPATSLRLTGARAGRSLRLATTGQAGSTCGPLPSLPGWVWVPDARGDQDLSGRRRAWSVMQPRFNLIPGHRHHLCPGRQMFGRHRPAGRPHTRMSNFPRLIEKIPLLSPFLGDASSMRRS